MIRMNDSMNIEQYQPTKTWMFRFVPALSLVAAMGMGIVGCRGTAPSFSQALNSFGAPARVPPPAQGSYQVPSSYSGGAGAPSPANSGLGGSSFGNGPKTSQHLLPTNNLLNGISNAQSQLLTATNNARNSVNRAADGINSSVELASARVDRIGQGVSQASAILSEAATAPIISYPEESPMPEPSNSGRLTDTEASNANWKTPIKR
jgi:hypothetical protein